MLTDCASSKRYGYFGQVTPEVVRLMFCKVSGCLTDGRIFLSESEKKVASEKEMVSLSTRDITGLRMLQREDVDVRFLD